MQDAWVFDPSTHAYLGMAYINNETSALAEKTEVSRAELKRQIAIKRSSNKLHKTIATTDIENLTTQQRIMLLAKANQIADMGKDTKPAKSMCFPSIETTQMDIALRQKKQLDKKFTEDLSVLGIHRQKAAKKKRDLIVFPSEREQVAL